MLQRQENIFDKNAVSMALLNCYCKQETTDMKSITLRTLFSLRALREISVFSHTHMIFQQHSYFADQLVVHLFFRE